jgi:uncharacterized protein (DUF305 family)
MRRLLLLVPVAVSACAAQTSPPPAHPHQAPAISAAGAGAGYTVADVRFMQDMIGHHTQALVMAAMAPTHGASTNVLRLAQKIDISQRDEIGMMKDWLRQRSQPVPDSVHLHAMMPGLLTPEELKRLDAARGAEFDRLFLSFMIRHHEGALMMVEKLFETAGAAQDPDLFRFVTDVDADQRDEIYAMQQLLETLR